MNERESQLIAQIGGQLSQIKAQLTVFRDRVSGGKIDSLTVLTLWAELAGGRHYVDELTGQIQGLFPDWLTIRSAISDFLTVMRSAIPIDGKGRAAFYTFDDTERFIPFNVVITGDFQQKVLRKIDVLLSELIAF